jgi:REP element-mobilizing transposase RayT
LRVDTIERLRNLVRAVRQKHPFDILAWVVLPDRLHALGELPEGDGSSRVFRGVRGDLLPKWSTR